MHPAQTDGGRRPATTGAARESNLARFTAYAIAFEQVLATDEWERLEEFFAPEAEHQVVGGGPLALLSLGRDAVINDLHRAVDELDRRFDRRLPEIISGPTERGDVVWIDFRLTFQRAGIPDLVFEGTHGTTYRDGRIIRIDEALTNAATERIEAYLQTHDADLLPAPPPLEPPAAPTHGRPETLADVPAAATRRTGRNV